MATLDHERLEVYHIALDFLPLADEVANALPSGRAYLNDQLHRASTSIVLNIAEGAGEFSKREKARFYRMALRSSTECAAILDVCRRLSLAPEGELLAGKEILVRVVAMLVKLVRTVSGLESGTGKGTGRGTGTEKGQG
jgi:four helix bundle protein